MQHCWPTTPNIVGCYILHPFAHPVACCWMLLRVVAQSLKPVKLFSQQLPTFLLFRDRRSVAQQCWIRLHSSSNIVGATHTHYAWFTKTYGLYPSHDALQVPTLLGVVASVCMQPYKSFLLFMCKLWYSLANKPVNMIIYIWKTRRFVTKQGHRHPRFYSEARVLSTQL